MAPGSCELVLLVETQPAVLRHNYLQLVSPSLTAVQTFLQIVLFATEVVTWGKEAVKVSRLCATVSPPPNIGVCSIQHRARHHIGHWTMDILGAMVCQHNTK